MRFCGGMRRLSCEGRWFMEVLPPAGCFGGVWGGTSSPSCLVVSFLLLFLFRRLAGAGAPPKPPSAAAAGQLPYGKGLIRRWFQLGENAGALTNLARQSAGHRRALRVGHRGALHLRAAAGSEAGVERRRALDLGKRTERGTSRGGSIPGWGGLPPKAARASR